MGDQVDAPLRLDRRDWTLIFALVVGAVVSLVLVLTQAPGDWWWGVFVALGLSCGVGIGKVVARARQRGPSDEGA